MAEEKKESKNARWLYDAETGIAKVTFPTGEVQEFDLSELPETCLIPLKFYGFKQWVSSNFASFKTPTDKITSAKTDYDEAVLMGLELSTKETTVIRIIGKTGSARESVSTKVNKELEQTCLGFLEASGGKISKQAQTWFTSTVAKITDEAMRKDILAKANITV